MSFYSTLLYSTLLYSTPYYFNILTPRVRCGQAGGAAGGSLLPAAGSQQAT
ncbi:MAG: hypothetical protein ABIK48_06835 [candidate division WOR-3 bacterium]